MIRVKKSYDAKIRASDIKLSNRALLEDQPSQKPVWCFNLDDLQNDEIVVAEIERQLAENYFTREQAFQALLKFSPDTQTWNMDFVSKFYTYFLIDEDCICKQLFDPEITGEDTSIFELGQVFATGKVGSASELLLKDSKERYVVKSVRVSRLKKYLSVVPLAITQAAESMNPGISANTWTFKKSRGVEKGVIVIQNDDFTNQTCLHMILNLLLGPNPNYIRQYDAFYCQNTETSKYFGYNVMPLSNGGNLFSYLNKVEVTDELLIEIMRQICTPLVTLKQPQHAFVHADLKCMNIFVNLTDDEQPIFQIADYDKSSVFWNGARFYNASKDYTAFSSYLTDDYKVKVHRSSQLYYDLYSYTQAYANIPIVQLYTMHNPYGFFLSYDFYTMMMSLLQHPRVWEFVKSRDTDFMSLWRKMWFDEADFDKVMNFVERSHLQEKQTQSMTDMNRFYSSIHLKFRFDFEYIYEHLGLPTGPQARSSVSSLRGLKERQNSDELYITQQGSGHVCTHIPFESWCNTNTYSYTKLGFSGRVTKLYDWDNFE